MIIQRRGFLLGLASLLAAPAIVRIDNIMPVRSILPNDPLIAGIRYQTWPFGMPHPDEWMSGSIGPEGGKGVLKPTSHWLKLMERHAMQNPTLVWQPITRS